MNFSNLLRLIIRWWQCSPDITLKMEISGTQYRFRGIYDGERALSAKLLKLMENEKEFEQGADKTNDKR